MTWAKWVFIITEGCVEYPSENVLQVVRWADFTKENQRISTEGKTRENDLGQQSGMGNVSLSSIGLDNLGSVWGRIHVRQMMNTFVSSLSHMDGVFLDICTSIAVICVKTIKSLSHHWFKNELPLLVNLFNCIGNWMTDWHSSMQIWSNYLVNPVAGMKARQWKLFLTHTRKKNVSQFSINIFLNRNSVGLSPAQRKIMPPPLGMLIIPVL